MFPVVRCDVILVAYIPLVLPSLKIACVIMYSMLRALFAGLACLTTTALSGCLQFNFVFNNDDERVKLSCMVTRC